MRLPDGNKGKKNLEKLGEGPVRTARRESQPSPELIQDCSLSMELVSFFSFVDALERNFQLGPLSFKWGLQARKG